MIGVWTIKYIFTGKRYIIYMSKIKHLINILKWDKHEVLGDSKG